MNEDANKKIKQGIKASLKKNSVVILPPLDVMQSIELIKEFKFKPTTTILDPWFNKGVGGVRDDYEEFILNIVKSVTSVSDHIMLWGFPEIVAKYLEKIPQPLKLVTWLTWYYKNNPSVIRGWRSSQMTCLHLAKNGTKVYPENFLNEKQKEKLAIGKLRFIPGPTSVIEAPLNIGFVGRNEQTGHPAQKPVSVYEKIVLMTTKEKDLLFDPMSGSGTTGEVAKKFNRLAIISDLSEEYTQIAEKRLNIKRIKITKTTLKSISKQSS